MHVVKPTLDEDAVVRLELEILSHVINYNGLGQVPSDSAQVFYKDRSVVQGMLPVQPVSNVLLLVDLVQDPVGVLHKYMTITLLHLRLAWLL